MCSSAQSKQKSVEVAWQGSVAEVRSWKKSSPTSPTAANGSASDARLVMWALHRAMLLFLCLRRGEELGDDLDREDAVDPALMVDHGRILGLALKQVGQRVAHHVVAIQQRAEGG